MSCCFVGDNIDSDYAGDGDYDDDHNNGGDNDGNNKKNRKSNSIITSAYLFRVSKSADDRN